MNILAKEEGKDFLEENLIMEISSQIVDEQLGLLSQKLKFSAAAVDLERMNFAREKLNYLQQQYVMQQIFTGKRQPSGITGSFLKLNKKLQILQSSSSEALSMLDEENEEIEEIEEEETCAELQDDAWLGFFKGFKILSEDEELCLSENKQCIDISDYDPKALDSLLHAGVRCFTFDLFKGTGLENQKNILRLRENELSISRESGFPVMTTLFGMLSPRLQFTGILEPADAIISLEKGHALILTYRREYSIHSSATIVFVNARFLIDDCKVNDFILIGPTIQVKIEAIIKSELHCTVMEPGLLRSRLPVRFPGRCNRTSVSLEELEDITFAREVGVQVLISYTPGNRQYYGELNKTLSLLNCEDIRLGTRIVINEIKEEYDEDLNWIADSYDVFLLELTMTQRPDECRDREISEISTDILELSSGVVNFIKKLYDMRKPIILNASLIAERRLFVHPSCLNEIFFYPDRYLFRNGRTENSFYFLFLQNAYFKQLASIQFARPFYDKSLTGSDTMARSCVATAEENDAQAFIVYSITPDMSITISHFRPSAPIVFVTDIRSASDYISMYHNIILLYYSSQDTDINHAESSYRGLVYGLAYLKSRRIISKDKKVVLVYTYEEGAKFPDRYTTFKFPATDFAENLKKVLKCILLWSRVNLGVEEKRTCALSV
uniref:Pyruvate kinase C-terminal domain-containing protein n=1 Tax=Glossina brevipalpis TaxID=37001 RepID=A0A1A9WHL7_9MUSC